MREFNRRKDRLLLLLAVTCTAAGAYAYYRYSVATKQLETWRTERCAITPVDFSQAGEVRIALPTKRPDAPHGYIVYLDPGCEDLPSPLPRGEIRIDGQDSASVATPLSGVFQDHRKDDNGYFLSMTLGSPESAQTVTIQVAEGSPAWAGLKSVVFARYWLCGCEVLPLVWWSLLACTAGFIAAIFWAVIAWRLAWPRPVRTNLRENSVSLSNAEPSDAADSR